MRSFILPLSLLVLLGCSDGGGESSNTSSCAELGLCAGAGGLGGSPGSSGGSGGSDSGVNGGSGGGSGGTTGGSGGTTGGSGGATGGSGGAAAVEPACPGGSVDGQSAQILVADGAFLLDVRSATEYATDGLPGAENIPLDELAARLAEVPADAVIVTYCASGTRSRQAATLLAGEGFDVCDLGARANWFL